MPILYDVVMLGAPTVGRAIGPAGGVAAGGALAGGVLSGAVEAEGVLSGAVEAGGVLSGAVEAGGVLAGAAEDGGVLVVAGLLVHAVSANSSANARTSTMSIDGFFMGLFSFFVLLCPLFYN